MSAIAQSWSSSPAKNTFVNVLQGASQFITLRIHVQKTTEALINTMITYVVFDSVFFVRNFLFVCLFACFV
jgi:hypothetical protein